MPNRWLIALAGVVMQIALGAVYASELRLRIPLTESYGWSIGEVTFAFTIEIFGWGLRPSPAGSGCVAWARGRWRLPPARSMDSACSSRALPAAGSGCCTCSYGLIAGIGLGLGYIVPVATLVKWFPDRRGMITGIAVAGFGSGALITAPLATRLIPQVGALNTFRHPGASVVPDRGHGRRLLHAESAGRLPPRRLDTVGGAAAATFRTDVHTLTGSDRHVAVVWAVGVAVPEHDRRNRDHLPGRSDGPGDGTERRQPLQAGLVGIMAMADGAGRAFLLATWLSEFIGQPRTCSC